ncbi:globin [Micromonospora sp. NPDC049679]|uniref:globin n=1 Tax=Micromonospora sp. NPDC049679 TaxID=3155920 RepID=UPI0033F2CCA8
MNPAGERADTGRPTDGEPATFFDAIGGEPTFRKLVDEFYAGVAEDPLLRPMYPEADLAPAADRMTLFLMQYWGGPNTYSVQRGHPRLRMRHAPFRVGPAERDAWLSHMRRAVLSLELPADQEAMLWDYLERAAYFMVNTPDTDDDATSTNRPNGA